MGLQIDHVHHGIDHYEGARPAHARAWGERKTPSRESHFPEMNDGASEHACSLDQRTPRPPQRHPLHP